MSSASPAQLPLFAAARCQTSAAPERSVPSPRRGRSRGEAGALDLCVLGSGSGGNCTVLRAGEQALLLDAGFGPATTRRRLAQARVALEQVRAICLTHLDQDHFRRSWPRTLLNMGIRLFVHHWHLPALARFRGAGALFDAGLIDTFDSDAFTPITGVVGRGVRLQHDRQGTIGFRFEAQLPPASADPTAQAGRGAARAAGSDGGPADNPPRQSGCYGGAVGYATDLGHVPGTLVELLSGVDVLCLESNYDEHMTIHSSRPTFVNRRNMSRSGHLSNEQAFEALRRITAVSPHGNPRDVLLMHRSSQCNHAMKVRRTFERDAAPGRRITLVEQRRRTRWFHVRPLRANQRCQMTLGQAGR